MFFKDSSVQFALVSDSEEWGLTHGTLVREDAETPDISLDAVAPLAVVNGLNYFRRYPVIGAQEGAPLV